MPEASAVKAATADLPLPTQTTPVPAAARALQAAAPLTVGAAAALAMPTQPPSTVVSLPTLDAAVHRMVGHADLMTVSGKAAAGATVQIALRVGDLWEVLDVVTAGADGSWSGELPAVALGRGEQHLACRTWDAEAGLGPWSNQATMTLDDPEVGAVHVGADLRARLLDDAAAGRDATADLQAVADEADGLHTTMLDIPAGTYIVSRTIYLSSCTILDAPGVALRSAPQFVLAPYGSEEDATIHDSLIANRGWAGGPPDHDIQVRNLTCDFAGTDTGGSAAVRLVGAQNVLVEDCSFTGNEDGTAFMGVDGGAVVGSTAYGTTNYGFDNWRGPKNTVIRNNTVYADRFGGIAVTAQPTDGTTNAHAANISVAYNRVYGAERVGIDINALNAGSSEAGVTVYGNEVSGVGPGISVMGRVAGVYVGANTVTGTMNNPSIMLSNLDRNPAAPPEVTRAVVEGNFVSTSRWNGHQTGAISVQADGAEVVNNTLDRVAATSGVWLAGTGFVLGGNRADGAAATVDATFATGITTRTIAGVPDAGQGDAVVVPPLDNITFVTTTSTATGLSGLPLTAGDPGTYWPGRGAVGAAGRLTVVGSGRHDKIVLAGRSAQVWLQAGDEVAAGSAPNVYIEDAGAADDPISRGSGHSTLVVVGGTHGGARFRMGEGIKDVDNVTLATQQYNNFELDLNGTPGLSARSSDGSSTLVAGGPDQVLYAGAGSDTLVGWSGGPTEFAGRSYSLNDDKLLGLHAGDLVTFTDMDPGAFWIALPDYKGSHTSLLWASDGQHTGGLILPPGYSSPMFKEVPNGVSMKLELLSTV